MIVEESCSNKLLNRYEEFQILDSFFLYNIVIMPKLEKNITTNWWF